MTEQRDAPVQDAMENALALLTQAVRDRAECARSGVRGVGRSPLDYGYIERYAEVMKQLAGVWQW